MVPLDQSSSGGRFLRCWQSQGMPPIGLPPDSIRSMRVAQPNLGRRSQMLAPSAAECSASNIIVVTGVNLRHAVLHSSLSSTKRTEPAFVRKFALTLNRFCLLTSQKQKHAMADPKTQADKARGRARETQTATETQTETDTKTEREKEGGTFQVQTRLAQCCATSLLHDCSQTVATT